MKETNDEDKTGQSKLADHSRRDFIVSAATAVAGVSAANLLNLQPAERANAQNSVAIRTGPYLTEGMAAYSPTGPHELMKFQRRALGPNDVAIKIHYCGICHSDIHMIPGDWGKIQYPVNPGLIDTQIARDVVNRAGVRRVGEARSDGTRGQARGNRVGRAVAFAVRGRATWSATPSPWTVGRRCRDSRPHQGSRN